MNDMKFVLIELGMSVCFVSYLLLIEQIFILESNTKPCLIQIRPTLTDLQ